MRDENHLKSQPEIEEFDITKVKIDYNLSSLMLSYERHASITCNQITTHELDQSLLGIGKTTRKMKKDAQE